VKDFDCEGCGYCGEVCPVDAIVLLERKVGNSYISKTRGGFSMVHAALDIGADNSGKLVADVKSKARDIAQKEGKSTLIIDGSPGTGCPVVSSLSGADFVLIVTEPTVSGIHDMKRIHELIERFGISSGCIINKADLNAEVTDQIKTYLMDKDIPLVAELPYDEEFSKAIINKKTMVEYGSNEIKNEIELAWNKIKQIVGERR